MASDNLTVRVVCSQNELRSDKEWETWSLNFTISARALQCTFVVEEPYIHSLAEWRKLTDGKNRRLNLYQGSGDGSISVHAGIMKFRAMPSGGGGDVESVISVSLAAVAPALTAALDQAVADGLHFHR